MKHILKLNLCILFVIISTNIFSQKPDSIDFKQSIKNIVNDSTSKFYYNKLKNKLKLNPKELNNDDYYYLYYGQIFQSDYKPFKAMTSPAMMDFSKALKNGNCKNTIKFGLKILEDNPLHLTTLVNVCSCIKDIGYNDTSLDLLNRYESLIKVILSSGDGRSKESAIKIVNFDDDYIIKGAKGFLGGQEKLMTDNSHSYSIWEKGSETLYFEDVFIIKKY